MDRRNPRGADPIDAEFERFQRQAYGIQRQSLPASGLIAFLVGAIVSPLVLLMIFAFIDGLPTFGKLNGCEDFATECAAYAEGLK